MILSSRIRNTVTFFITIILDFFFGLKIFHSFWPFNSATVVTWHFITIRFAVIVLVPNALMNLFCLVKTILCSLLSTMDLLSWFYSVPFSYFLIWNYKVVCKWEHEIFWTFESRCHTVGQIPKKCKETSNLMWVSLIWFISFCFVETYFVQ